MADPGAQVGGFGVAGRRRVDRVDHADEHDLAFVVVHYRYWPVVTRSIWRPPLADSAPSCTIVRT